MKETPEALADRKKWESTLKACPWCKTAKFLRIESNGFGDFYVRCATGDDEDDGVGCGVQSSDVRCESRQHAAYRWNRDLIDFSAPVASLKDTFPVILYFANDADREEFIQAVRLEKPNLKPQPL